MQITDRATTEPVTTIVEQAVISGKETLFEDWSRQIRESCRNFPGYLGTEIVCPEDDKGIFISIFRFDSYDHLEAWMLSEERSKHLKNAQSFCAAPPKISRYRSLEFMFPTEDTGKPPSREKMALITYLGLVPPVYYVPPLVTEHLTNAPMFATLISLGIITPMMVYIIMPVLTQLFKPWLKR